MKKRELLAALAEFDDADDLLVEGWENGFDEPTIYVTAVRARKAAEFLHGLDSDFISDASGTGRIIIGTPRGCATF